MAVSNRKKSQGRVSPSSPKKTVAKKGAAAKAVLPKKPVKAVTPAKKTSSAPLRKTGVTRGASKPQAVMAISVVQTTRVSVRKEVIPVAAKPSAQTCPLVLDGIIMEEDFSPRDCFSCDEFDCRFYAAEEKSGPLGSRLFAGEDEGDEEGDEWGLFGSDRGEDEGEDWGGEDDQ